MRIGRRRFTWLDLTFLISVTLCCVLGRLDLAVAIWLSFMAIFTWWRLQQRAASRARAALATGVFTRYEARESIVLWYPPAVVWDLIGPAENTPLLNPDVVRGYQVPGTPDGVGERQASVHTDGTTSVGEVVELIPERRAVVKTLWPAPQIPSRTVHTVEPVAGGCILTLATEIDLPPNKVLPATWADPMHTHWRTYLATVERVLPGWSTGRSAAHNTAWGYAGRPDTPGGSTTATLSSATRPTPGETHPAARHEPETSVAPEATATWSGRHRGP